MQITGLILAGGRGMRMGEADKGLQRLHGMPLVQHTIRRLQPQVDTLLLNANRNLPQYQAFGLPVCTDEAANFDGPLAGLQAGLRKCQTPLLIAAPCDSPFFPEDIVQRLHSSLRQENADLAIACTMSDNEQRDHPVFCLLKKELLDDLDSYLQGGKRKMIAWQACQKMVRVMFSDEAAFRNINTLQDLQQLETE